MPRTRLPDRREGYTFEVPHPDPASKIVWTVKLGFDEASELKEVFISCNKLTTAMHTAGLEIATLVSIALQYGVDIKTLAAAMPREDDPNDIFMAKAEGRAPKVIPQGAAGAVLDAILSELDWFKAMGSTA